jgi:signal transduction histidine kinase
VLGVDGQAAGRALGAVEQSSRAAVGEMRQLLGVLRSDQGLDGEEGAADDRSPQPSVDDLDQLVTDCADGGLDVTVERVGDPRPLPSTVSLSLYRTVQEALANVRRHSSARAARVTVRHSDEPGSSAWVEVEVLDEGRPRAGDTTGSGLGHVGMRERAELHGGHVEIGPRPSGGYRVRARYPVPDREVDVQRVDRAEPGAVAR